MIPIRDTIRTKTTPYVNYSLITACGLVFVYELALGTRGEDFVRTLGVVPAIVSGTLFQGHVSVRAIVSLFASIFVHGGWVHLLGNMLYLYIFGDNVEDRLGHARYMVFFVLCGVGSMLIQVYFQQTSTVPVIGASGAIAGVLGAYLLLYPKAKVLTILPLFLFFPTFEVPAFVFLGVWFVIQFIQGAASLHYAEAGGVAWWSHAGGFLVGAALLPLFLLVRRS